MIRRRRRDDEPKRENTAARGAEGGLTQSSMGDRRGSPLENFAFVLGGVVSTVFRVWPKRSQTTPPLGTSNIAARSLPNRTTAMPRAIQGFSAFTIEIASRSKPFEMTPAPVSGQSSFVLSTMRT